ncbi:potassium/proton antiporter [Allorhodopirellula heiligendammensis]|uniref:K(+)/H(+) antiporter NhaP n=1 Tax=Allorhodopirellula heiligendammensis TaxID=2714739 RepID=A0A5C6C4B5_9BACT|nr:potassium/proton antiporter [Allorhodopirellula heiligendammensis]TWU19440.1 K(+)/H(+) antiporter NhaP [Allorhodopirellula heiligendammensis]
MVSVETGILITGVLLLLGIASNKFSSRMGVPVLVLFLLVGMLAGSEGIGGIEFENYTIANGIGTIALCVILFDGGLRTPFHTIRSAWKPAGMLATLGVFITALITGLAAAWILKLSILEGLLLGSIVGSTDAAVVFTVLRGGGVNIRRRLAETLEVESGSNDPMAIFLTVGLIQVLTGTVPFGLGLLNLFVSQIVFGTIAGVLVGGAGVWMLQRIRLDAAGLYPVLATALGLVSFGSAAALGGSGFLAVYLTGIVIGNRRPVFFRGILLFHDAAAWICQILMFIALGILSFPSRLWDVAPQALMISAVLMFVARPIAVFACASPFRFSARELLFLSWVGLKGAVPITLATFPMLADLSGAPLIFDTVFFVVLISALVQGWSLPTVAKYLKLVVPTRRPPPVTLEISSLRNVEADIVEYFVDDSCHAADCMIKDLALPAGVVVALIVRDERIIPPQGRTQIEVGDHVIVVLNPQVRTMVDRVFAHGQQPLTSLPTALEFPLRGSITVGEVERFYGFNLHGRPEETLDELMRERLGEGGVRLAASSRFEQIELVVRELSASGLIEHVGMVILPEPEVSDVPAPEPSPTAAPGIPSSHGKAPSDTP